MAKKHACTTAEGSLDVYSYRPSYISIADFRMANVQLPESHKDGEVAIALKEIALI